MGFTTAAAITPSDTVGFTQCDAIYVGGAGAGAVVALVGGSAVTFAAVPVGTTLRVSATRVNSTSTTATNLVALYGNG